MNQYNSCCWLVLFLVGKVAARAFSTNSTNISNSTFISAEVLDAMTLTTISWTLQGYVVVYFDKFATDALRFARGENATLRYSSVRVCTAVPVVPVLFADRMSNKKAHIAPQCPPFPRG